MEEWRPVDGYLGFYEVSNLGRVRSVDRIISAPDSHGNPGTRFFKGKMRRHSYKVKYLVITLSSYGKTKTHNVHVLVARAFLGSCPKGMEVCHINHNRHDPRLRNLKYDTRQSNALAREKRKRMEKREK